MTEPTICIKCKHCNRGEYIMICRVNPRMNYLTGVEELGCCVVKNNDGNCPDYEPLHEKELTVYEKFMAMSLQEMMSRIDPHSQDFDDDLDWDEWMCSILSPADWERYGSADGDRQREWRHEQWDELNNLQKWEACFRWKRSLRYNDQEAGT